MKIIFTNDGKQREQSWCASGEVSVLDDLYRSADGFASVEITAYGSTKREAHENFVQSVQKIATDMQQIIEEFATDRENGDDL